MNLLWSAYAGILDEVLIALAAAVAMAAIYYVTRRRLERRDLDGIANALASLGIPVVRHTATGRVLDGRAEQLGRDVTIPLYGQQDGHVRLRVVRMNGEAVSVLEVLVGDGVGHELKSVVRWCPPTEAGPAHRPQPRLPAGDAERLHMARERERRTG